MQELAVQRWGIWFSESSRTVLGQLSVDFRKADPAHGDERRKDTQHGLLARLVTLLPLLAYLNAVLCNAVFHE